MSVVVCRRRVSHIRIYQKHTMYANMAAVCGVRGALNVCDFMCMCASSAGIGKNFH